MTRTIAGLCALAAILLPSGASADSITGLSKTGFGSTVYPFDTAGTPWTPPTPEWRDSGFHAHAPLAVPRARVNAAPPSGLLENPLLAKPFYSMDGGSPASPRPGATGLDFSPKWAMAAMVMDSPEPGSLGLLLVGLVAARLGSLAGRRTARAPV